MTRVLAAAEVEAAANGRGEITVNDSVLVTPLARDRATALGVRLVDSSGGRPGRRSPGPSPPDPSGVAGIATVTGGRNGELTADDLARLRAESAVRSVARRVLLRQGVGLARLEDVVAAVLARLQTCGGGSGCTCAAGGRHDPDE
jgi:hypothetical protein